MAPNTPQNESKEYPKDRMAVWIETAKPQFDSLMVGVAHDGAIFLLVGRYSKEIRDKKWSKVGLAPSTLAAINKHTPDLLKAAREA